MDQPDAFEKTRLILARARRQGQPFEVVWPRAVDAAAPPIDHSRHMTQAVRDRDDERAALLAAEPVWRAAFERKPPPQPARQTPVGFFADEGA